MSYTSSLQHHILCVLFALFCLLAVGLVALLVHASSVLCCLSCTSKLYFSLQVTIFEGGEEDKKLYCS